VRAAISINSITDRNDDISLSFAILLTQLYAIARNQTIAPKQSLVFVQK